MSPRSTPMLAAFVLLLPTVAVGQRADPDPARWETWPAMKAANELIETEARSAPALHYVDIAEAMLGPSGEPIRKLFVDGLLHLSEAGYDVWTPHVERAIAAIRSGG